MPKETLAEMVAEYNKLTGKSIKGFKDRKAAERALKNARVLVASDKQLSKAKSSGKKLSSGSKKTVGLQIAVGNKKYSSVTAAFKDLKIASGSLGILRRIRKELHANGEATIEGHKLRVVK